MTIDDCPSCRSQTSQNVFVAMLSRHGGLGAPFFLLPFLRRTSLVGKMGRRSRWGMCTDCRSVLPHDEAAADYAASLGHEQGFLNSRDADEGEVPGSSTR